MNMKLNGNSLVIGLAGILWILYSWESSYAEWLALILIIVAGIPHGSFDLRVANKKWPLLASKPALAIGLYSLVGITMSLLCFLAPTLGLLLFLIISVIHFADGEHLASKSLTGTAELIGLTAVILPILLHLDEAKTYIQFFIPPNSFPLSEASTLNLGYGISLLVVLYLFANYLMGYRTELVQLLICLMSWHILPPLAGFGVWFLGRHSRHHLEECAEFFTERAASHARLKGFPIDFLAISVTAILLIVPLGYWFDFTQIHELFSASIILIAGLTLPHILVTYNIKRTLRGNT
jgi:Brp/Blh family beta-carotene 15,15'-monooxygenase